MRRWPCAPTLPRLPSACSTAAAGTRATLASDAWIGSGYGIMWSRWTRWAYGFSEEAPLRWPSGRSFGGYHVLVQPRRTCSSSCVPPSGRRREGQAASLNKKRVRAWDASSSSTAALDSFARPAFLFPCMMHARPYTFILLYINITRTRLMALFLFRKSKDKERIASTSPQAQRHTLRQRPRRIAGPLSHASRGAACRCCRATGGTCWRGS